MIAGRCNRTSWREREKVDREELGGGQQIFNWGSEHLRALDLQ